MLTSGRNKPADDQNHHRGEGVAIVLSDQAVKAWKASGSHWKAWSSRIISACLKLKNDKLHVISCYAPTRLARREDKDQFYDTLDTIISPIPTNDKYVLLGDLNARIESREHNGEQWDGVRGPHGYGTINDAGKELLPFLSLHQATICNTWFTKKDIHKVTWQHPKSKKWGCIDYVIMRQKDKRICLDVTVKRGAECNTDHQLLCATVRMAWHCRGQREKQQRRGRYDVSKLLKCDDNVGNDSQQSLRESYIDCVVGRTRTGWPEDGTVEDKWQKICSALITTSDELLGLANSRQPNWLSSSKREDLTSKLDTELGRLLEMPRMSGLRPRLCR